MNYFQHIVAVIKEDVNKDNSQMLRLFQLWLNILFAFIGIVSLPFFIALFFPF
ncbi:hypothetical protein [Niallia sp. 01092]|uniref:hypothetical protein n=1 Tax=unclassified Niallia TaxID=2837522 RepID=UPI003FD2F889